MQWAGVPYPRAGMWSEICDGGKKLNKDLDLLMLGPLEVHGPDGPVPMGGHNARIALAALLLSANHAVATDTLVWAIWGDNPPASAESTVQSHISRLRHLLGHDAIILEDHSYLLEIECEQIDACRFERLVHQAESKLGSDPAGASHDARGALDLWRGPVLGDLGDEEFAHFEGVRLHEMRLEAVEIEMEAEVLVGRELEAVPRLQALTGEYPYRERFWHLLIKSLARVDRRIEASQAYDRYCRILEDQGFEPSFRFGELIS